MARTVFIFGAGASRHAGAPLMTEFYRKVADIQEAAAIPAYKSEFDLVVKASSHLDNVYAKMAMSYHENIEELFATFEMAALLHRLGPLDPKELMDLPKAMRSVIAATIENSMRYVFRKGEGLQAPRGYSSFVDMLASLASKHPGEFALVTFNYDYGLDFALDSAGLPFHYSLSTDDRSAVGIPLLKLHGSLNWGVCPQCKAIVPATIDRWKKTEIPHNLDQLPGEESKIPLQVSEFLPKTRHVTCGTALAREPYIVPPTFNKTQYHAEIAPVWRAALLHLSQARNIFVIGYSVPDTDQFFRHLFALSLAGGPLVNTLAVVNPSTEAYVRISSMVGQKLKPALLHVPAEFEDSRQNLRDILRHQGL